MSSPTAACLVALLGVTFGYEPSPDAADGYDYLVQVEPELLEPLQQGKAADIEANIPPEINPIRRIRIVVGREELPQQLRPETASELTAAEPTEPRRHRVGRATYSEGTSAGGGDLAASSNLLAQTGPAGGFGRSADGFKTAPRSPAAPTGPTTIPPASTRSYATPRPLDTTPRDLGNQLGNQLEQGFGTVQEGLQQTRDTLRNTTNNLGQQGSQLIDRGRQVVSDVIAPPEQSSFNPQRPVLQNLTNRATDELRNTADAFREAWGNGNNTNHFPAAGNASGENAASAFSATPEPNNWGTSQNNPNNDAANGISERYLAEPSTSERSVMTSNQSRSSFPEMPPAPINMQRNTTATSNFSGNSNIIPPTNSLRTGSGQPDNPYGYPQQPAEESFPSSPRRPNAGNGIVNPMVPANPQTMTSLPLREDFDDYRNNGYREPTPTGFPSNSAQPNAAITRTEGEPFGNFGVPNASNSSLDGSSFGTASPAEAINTWKLPAAQQGAIPPTATASSPSGSTASVPLYLLAWAIAIGSVVTNLYQWLNIVDLRNKYRVALRRTSPGFARSMAN